MRYNKGRSNISCKFYHVNLLDGIVYLNCDARSTLILL
ncbi:hypothetical protein BVRB_7g167110 [Beta vulgaris subsp. vulgaris]|nr:hypothetical protein BVRB_7g167110 [Beta vulgaris subsp. vulgaris]